jgi:transketolase
MEISKKNIIVWSTLGQRATYGQVLYELAKERDDFFVMSADVGTSSGLKRFAEEISDRYINVGIAEQNLVSIASGMAKEGNTVFVSSFSTFMSMRAYEQMRIDAAYMHNKVRAIGIVSGVSAAYQGNTHFGLEDAALMRCIPDMTVVEPADCLEVFKTVQASLDYDGPMYIRLTGVTRMPSVYKQDYDFEIGKGIKLADGEDVFIVATGSMVYNSLQVAKKLSEEGISSTVINMHTIKPLDKNILLENLTGKKLIVTVEEHITIGGLGSAVAEALADVKDKPAQVLIGLPNEFLKSASYTELLDHYGLSVDKIVNRVKECL